jgi:hypothetical protein
MKDTTDSGPGPNPFPVDSATRGCCNGIGRHTPHCPDAHPNRRVDIRVPAGVAHVDAWEPGDHQPYRLIYGATREIADGRVRVLTAAVQWADGGIDVEGRVGVPNVTAVFDSFNDLLNSAQARQLAAALLAAADEIDGWVSE